jgi:hypothetical protein
MLHANATNLPPNIGLKLFFSCHFAIKNISRVPMTAPTHLNCARGLRQHVDKVWSHHFDLQRDTEHGHTAWSTRRQHTATQVHRTPADRTRAAFRGTQSTRGQTSSPILDAHDGIRVVGRLQEDLDQ